MHISFYPKAWEDYTYWLVQDKKKVKKINQLIKDINESPFTGLGKPEPLKHDLTGWWSRRIDNEHRLIYRIKEKSIEILACRYHYL